MSAAYLFISLCLVYFSVNISLVLLRNYRGQQFFKTKTPKLPVAPNPSLLIGHLKRIAINKKNWKVIEDLHDQYGTTFGFYWCDKPWVATKDLDLLKLIEVDQAHKHIDRANLGIPFSDFNNSVFQVNGDKWRKVRRAISPALTNHKVRSDEVTSDIESIIKQLEAGINHRMRKSVVRRKKLVERELDRSGGGGGSSSSSGNAPGTGETSQNGRAEAVPLAGAPHKAELEMVEEQSMILHADDMFQRYTLAVIFLITYKRESKIDFKSDHDEWVDHFEKSARSITNPFIWMSMAFPFMRPMIEFLIQLHPVGKTKAKIIDYIIKATDLNRLARAQHERAQRKLSLETGAPECPFGDLKKSGTFKRRLVDTIIDALMEKKMQYDEFLGSTLFLLLAGFMTTSDTITCLVWQLARNPSIQEKLREAIRRDGIDSEYLNWCVLETIRYHPAVPLGVGRVLGEDVHLNGTYLPKGCFVQPSTHGIHHDPSIWPEPESFLPERWAKSGEFHPAAFMGFGLGPRNCIGGKLAMHEIKLAAQLLLSNYRIEKCPETPDKYDFTSPGMLFTSVDVPIKVRLVMLEKKNLQGPSQTEEQN